MLHIKNIYNLIQVKGIKEIISIIHLPTKIVSCYELFIKNLQND